MPNPRRMPLIRATVLATASVALLAGCDDFDIDMRTNSANTSNAAKMATAPRPEPDNRGVISYPTYQVVVARAGDTVTTVAGRVGLTGDELAAYNGLKPDTALRGGEILALPRRVAEPSPATGSLTTGPIQNPESIDITTLADGAISRAEGQATVTTASGADKVAVGVEPIRHKVERGETAYSIARLYGVSVTSLSEWNGLGPDLLVREGQYLMIPVAAVDSVITPAPAPVQDENLPGEASPTPVPPSAAKPLPAETASTEPVATPASPDLSADKTVSSRLAMPVSGNIIRGYKKGSNDGIDISAAAGTAVKAADDGSVAIITRDTDQVPILVLSHSGNLLTAYAFITDLKVKEGDPVKRGQTIGTVMAGEPSFLHFEVFVGEKSVDPMGYLQ